jgi:CO/xanthine dehydrogenase Mo-binding subunit
MAEHAGAVRRREDPRLITGTGAFIDDLRVPGCLHVAMLRSPHAPHPALPVPCRIRPLATDIVRFVGEPLVAVVADSAYHAWDALDLIQVDYEPLPALVDVEAALAADAPVLHAEIGSNVVADWQQRVGDAEAACRTADVVVRTRIRLARGTAHPLEPRGLVVRWDGDQCTVWGAIQLVHRHRGVIASQLGVPEEHVRVIAPPDVGGGFGTKAMFYPESLLSKLAVRAGEPPGVG